MDEEEKKDVWQILFEIAVRVGALEKELIRITILDKEKMSLARNEIREKILLDEKEVSEMQDVLPNITF